MNSLEFLPSVKEFYSGADILITGATGFFGRGLVEKLLSSCAEINKIYIVLRKRGNQNVQTRIKEFEDCELFTKLLSENSKSLEKLHIIEGDISIKGLGISDEDKTILSNVRVVFHTAASVRFDEPLKEAVLSTVRGTRDLLDICVEMRKLQAFVYISTAFSNCQNGTPQEVLQNQITERLYEDIDDYNTVIKIAETFDDTLLNTLSKVFMNFQPNTYLYSKALAENVCKSYENQLPLVVYRPAIVTGITGEPLRGWIPNLNGPTGIMIGITTGAIRCLLADSDISLDIVPVDLSVNGAIVAAWKRHTIDFSSAVYNSTVLKAPIHDLYYIGEKVYKDLHMNNSFWYMSKSNTTCRYNFIIQSFLFHLLPAIAVDFLLTLFNKPKMLLKLQRKIQAAQLAVKYFMCNNFDIRNENYLQLQLYLSNEEKSIFPVQKNEGVKDRVNYLLVQANHVRRYIMKEPDSTKELWRKRRLFLKFLDNVVKAFWYSALIYMFVKAF